MISVSAKSHFTASITISVTAMNAREVLTAAQIDLAMFRNTVSHNASEQGDVSPLKPVQGSMI
jgi:hypothetical protein